MRHSAVRYVSLALALVFLAASLAFRGGVARSRVPAPRAPEVAEGIGEPGEGLADFERWCARCHAADELARAFAGAEDRGLEALEMLAFLEAHGDAGAAEDVRIVAHLLRMSGDGR